VLTTQIAPTIFRVPGPGSAKATGGGNGKYPDPARNNREVALGQKRWNFSGVTITNVFEGLGLRGVLY
jgi:hypothetical protein